MIIQIVIIMCNIFFHKRFSFCIFFCFYIFTLIFCSYICSVLLRKKLTRFFSFHFCTSFVCKTNKQIFPVFLFNTTRYSHGESNILLRKVELDVILPRENKFDIKQKMPWNICYISYP